MPISKKRNKLPYDTKIQILIQRHFYGKSVEELAKQYKIKEPYNITRWVEDNPQLLEKAKTVFNATHKQAEEPSTSINVTPTIPVAKSAQAPVKESLKSYQPMKQDSKDQIIFELQLHLQEAHIKIRRLEYILQRNGLSAEVQSTGGSDFNHLNPIIR